MRHESHLSGSARLQRVLSALQRGGSVGVTALELFQQAATTDPKTAIWELKREGIAIESKWITIGRHSKRGPQRVKAYRLVEKKAA